MDVEKIGILRVDGAIDKFKNLLLENTTAISAKEGAVLCFLLRLRSRMLLKERALTFSKAFPT